MSKPINEPAFPVVSVADHEFTGMTLRDYFAAKAMREIDWKVKPLNESADGCYAVADAMLAARSAQPQILEVAMSDWIKVEDRLPGFPIEVIVAYHFDADGEPCLDTGLAILHPDGIWRGAGVFYQLGQVQKIAIRECIKKVTHWQPLPAPPTE